MTNNILTLSGHRIRGAGVILDEKNRLLMVENYHCATGDKWLSLPGGGAKPGESLVKAVIRETKEECNIDCVVKDTLYIREFADQYTSLHNLEVFFLLEIIIGIPSIGYDPEGDTKILSVKFMTKDEIINTELNVYPEILRSVFWDDVERDFKNREIYLGFHWPRKGSGI